MLIYFLRINVFAKSSKQYNNIAKCVRMLYTKLHNFLKDIVQDDSDNQGNFFHLNSLQLFVEP